MVTKNSNQAKKTLLDLNASWPLLIVYLLYIVGIYFAQRSTFGDLPSGTSQVAYVLVAAIVGLLVTFAVYNLGKILFAKLSGYKIRSLTCFGVVAERRSEKLKFRFDFLALLDVRLSFCPVDDDLKKNPTLTFIGGYIAELLVVAVALVLYFLFGFKHSGSTMLLGNGALFGMLYGFIIVFYELMPFRQDYPNDMFNIIVTRKEEDRQAFNLVMVNQRRELTGEDFLVPSFEDYRTFYRSAALTYVYLDQLYRNDLENALQTLNQLQYLFPVLPTDFKYFGYKEKAYLLFLTGNVAGADQTFFEIGKDFRKPVTAPTLLENFRIALFLNKDKESLDSLFKDYKKVLSRLQDSNRVRKEKALFRQVYDGVRKVAPDQYLPPLED